MASNYHGVLSRRNLILIRISRGPITKTNLAKELGYTASVGINKVINVLLKDGQITEDENFRCPHCSKVIRGIPLKREGKLLRLTLTGESACKLALDELRVLLGEVEG